MFAKGYTKAEYTFCEVSLVEEFLFISRFHPFYITVTKFC